MLEPELNKVRTEPKSELQDLRDVVALVSLFPSSVTAHESLHHSPLRSADSNDAPNAMVDLNLYSKNAA
jgi:hypothetical protein